MPMTNKLTIAFTRREAELYRSHGLLEARREDLLDYLAGLTKAGRKPRSSARLLSSLRQFYQLAVREHWLEVDPSALIEAPKLGRTLPKTLTEAEVRPDDIHLGRTTPSERTPLDPYALLEKAHDGRGLAAESGVE